MGTIYAVLAFACGFFFELKTFRFQRLKFPAWAYGLNLLFYSALGAACREIATYYRERGFETLSDLEQFFSASANVTDFVTLVAAGAMGGGCLVHMGRLAFDVEVPEHLQKTDADKEREKNIKEAKKEQEYRMMEEDVGLVAEEEPEYKNDDIDHEAELEEILKSRK